MNLSAALSQVRGLLLGIVGSAVVAGTCNPPPAIFSALLAVQVTCLALVFPSLRRAVEGFVRSQWKWLSLIAVIILGAVLWNVLRPPALPEEILQARREVREIQSRLLHTRTVGLLEAGAESPRRWALISDYDLLAIDGGETLRTYVWKGRKVAEDVRGPDPYPVERRYYRGPCNFATDYFDRSDVQVFVEYRQDCRHVPIILSPVPESPPRLLLPIPVVSYR